jgi:hypothetical protein
MELILGWRKGEDKIRELLELFVFCLYFQYDRRKGDVAVKRRRQAAGSNQDRRPAAPRRRRRNGVRAGTTDRRATGWIPCVCRGGRVGARAVSVADAGDTVRAGGRRLVCLLRGALRGEARGVECTFFRRVRHSAHVGMLCG